MSIAIWWIRRDLRLNDNSALRAALRAADSVLPLFIIDPALEDSPWTGKTRLHFLWGALISLDEDLRQRGNRLIIRRGHPLHVLTKLCHEHTIQTIYAEQDHSPYAATRDAEIAAQLPLKLMPGVTILPVGTILKQDNSPYTVFTPFRKRWRAALEEAHLDIWEAPKTIPTATEVSSESIPVPDSDSAAGFKPTSTEAQIRLQAFLRGGSRENGTKTTVAPVYRYKEARDVPALNATSMLSPYLRFGLIAVKQAYVGVREAIQVSPGTKQAQSAGVWLNELGWREFFINILHHFPHVRTRSFRPQFDHIHWRNDQNEFVQWQTGETGYPLIDAAMRQLRIQGWMHNRLRMVVAAFLVKDLLIDWRWGEKWFMQNLIDGDPAANNGGWQWAAGTGTDAAPYFRVFNPTTQATRFDPEGDYIRQWIPELQQVRTAHIHTPWKMTLAEQKQAGCRIDADYPSPIIEHAAARERALEVYQAAREASSLNA